MCVANGPTEITKSNFPPPLPPIAVSVMARFARDTCIVVGTRPTAVRVRVSSAVDGGWSRNPKPTTCGGDGR